MENYGQDMFRGMLMWVMETNYYWTNANLRFRIYNGSRLNTTADPKRYNFDGESLWGVTGSGMSRANFSGSYEYQPQAFFFYTTSGTTFDARAYKTIYK
jgi:hypothetical protein